MTNAGLGGGGHKHGVARFEEYEPDAHGEFVDLLKGAYPSRSTMNLYGGKNFITGLTPIVDPA